MSAAGGLAERVLCDRLHTPAGRTGTFGAVGQPDIPPPEGAASHCDDADYLDSGVSATLELTPASAAQAPRALTATRIVARMRMVRIAALIATTFAAGGAAAGVASAKTVTAYNIVSPSKLISCWAVLQSTEVDCTAPYLPDIGDLDSYFALRPHGKARLSQRGDFPGHSTPRRTLRYGDTWVRPGIRCAMRTTGLTCRNRDGHGFHIQRGNTRRF